MQSVQSKYVIRVYDSDMLMSAGNATYYLLLEFCDGGDLGMRLRTRGLDQDDEVIVDDAARFD